MRKSHAIFMLIALALMVTSCAGAASGDLRSTPTPLFLANAETEARAGRMTTFTPAPTDFPSQIGITPQPIALTETPPTAQAGAGSSSVAVTSQPRIMALGVRPRIVLRSQPDAAAAMAISVAGSQVMWADARSDDDRWVRVTITRVDSNGETSETAGWTAISDLNLFGDRENLPRASADGTLIAAAPTPTASAPGAPSAAIMTGRVTVTGLNVRGGPGVDQPIVGELRAGDAVGVVGRSEEGDWLNIEWPDAQDGAWVAARYIELTGSAVGLPVSGVATSPVPARAPGLSGKIVFQTAIGRDIYVVNADGTGLRRLTAGMDPALSPDGTRVAYARWESPHGVFVLDLRTGEEQRVATANEPRGPTWSPAGDRLAFAHKTGSTKCRGTPFGCISEDQLRSSLGGQDCADTPAGRICIGDFPVRTVAETGLAEITLADGGWQDLPYVSSPKAPQWHPKNEEVLYQTKGGLQVTVPGGDTRLLFDNADLSGATWAPDGQKLVAQIGLHDHTDIFLVDFSGNILQRLTEPLPSYERVRSPNNVTPTWSPDGRYILFLSDRDEAWRLYRMNADGSNQIPFLPRILADIDLRYDFAAERVANWAP